MDTITFESGATFHFSAWSVDGSAPSTFVQVEASTPGVAFDLVNDTAGIFTSTWCIISDSHASDAALWTAGTGCEDWGGNQGWFDEDSPVVGDRIFFTPGETYSITGWSVDGAPGAAVLITSNPPSASHALVAVSGGPFTSDWCVISHSDATPENDWTAGANSFDAGNNLANGWFTTTTTIYADALGCVVYFLTYAAQPIAHIEAGGVTVCTPTGIATNATGCVAESVQVRVSGNRPYTFVHADAHSAEAVAMAQAPSGEAHADASGADVVATAIGRPATVASSPSGSVTVALGDSGVLGAGVGLPGGVDVAVGTQGVGAGVTTDVVRALVEILAGRGETVLNVNIISGALVAVDAGPADASGVGHPAPLVVEVLVRDVDGRRTRRTVEFIQGFPTGILQPADSVVAVLNDSAPILAILDREG